MNEFSQASVGLIGAIVALIVTVVLRAKVRSSFQQKKMETEPGVRPMTSNFNLFLAHSSIFSAHEGPHG
jgi:hypothetical protein